jgi:HME family heavy-metal exporter
MAYCMLPGLKRLGKGESGLVRVLKRVYRAALEKAFSAGSLLIALVLLAVLAAGGAAALLPRAFLPAFNEGTFTINLPWPTSVRVSPCCRSRSMSASRFRTASTTCCQACVPRSR